MLEKQAKVVDHVAQNISRDDADLDFQALSHSSFPS